MNRERTTASFVQRSARAIALASPQFGRIVLHDDRAGTVVMALKGEFLFQSCRANGPMPRHGNEAVSESDIGVTAAPGRWTLVFTRSDARSHAP
jgi:hypothetical protein